MDNITQVAYALIAIYSHPTYASHSIDPVVTRFNTQEECMIAGKELSQMFGDAKAPYLTNKLGFKSSVADSELSWRCVPLK